MSDSDYEPKPKKRRVEEAKGKSTRAGDNGSVEDSASQANLESVEASEFHLSGVSDEDAYSSSDEKLESPGDDETEGFTDECFEPSGDEGYTSFIDEEPVDDNIGQHSDDQKRPRSSAEAPAL